MEDFISKTARQISKPAVIISWTSELCPEKLLWHLMHCNYNLLTTSLLPHCSVPTVAGYILKKLLAEYSCFLRRSHWKLFCNYSSQLKPLVHEVIKKSLTNLECLWILEEYNKALQSVCQLADGLESYVKVNTCTI